MSEETKFAALHHFIHPYQAVPPDWRWDAVSILTPDSPVLQAQCRMQHGMQSSSVPAAPCAMTPRMWILSVSKHSMRSSSQDRAAIRILSQRQRLCESLSPPATSSFGNFSRANESNANNSLSWKGKDRLEDAAVNQKDPFVESVFHKLLMPGIVEGEGGPVLRRRSVLSPSFLSSFLNKDQANNFIKATSPSR